MKKQFKFKTREEAEALCQKMQKQFPEENLGVVAENDYFVLCKDFPKNKRELFGLPVGYRFGKLRIVK